MSDEMKTVDITEEETTATEAASLDSLAEEFVKEHVVETTNKKGESVFKLPIGKTRKFQKENGYTEDMSAKWRETMTSLNRAMQKRMVDSAVDEISKEKPKTYDDAKEKIHTVRGHIDSDTINLDARLVPINKTNTAPITSGEKREQKWELRFGNTTVTAKAKCAVDAETTESFVNDLKASFDDEIANSI